MAKDASPTGDGGGHVNPVESEHGFTNAIVRAFLNSNLSLILIILSAAIGITVALTLYTGYVAMQEWSVYRPDDSERLISYAGERGELAMGTCDVSIPRDHSIGELEAPVIYRLEIRERPERHAPRFR